MLILGFETANFGASIALRKGECLLAAKRFEASYGQAGFLIPEIQSLLGSEGYTLRDVDGFVTTTGPGSFTGLRLGLAVGHALKIASHAPVLGVPSPIWIVESFLDAHPPAEVPLLVCLEARREDLYCQLFDPRGHPLKPPANILPQEVSTYAEGPCYALGNGTGRVLPSQEISLPKQHDVPTAEGLCRFADRILRSKKESQFPLTPLYVRTPDIGASCKKS